MKKITYPSKYFLKRTISLIKNGEEVDVIISSGWRRNILLQELPNLLENDDEAKPHWKFVIHMFAIMRFFTAYLYAKTYSYVITYFDEEDLIVSFKPKNNRESMASDSIDS